MPTTTISAFVKIEPDWGVQDKSPKITSSNRGRDATTKSTDNSHVTQAALAKSRPPVTEEVKSHRMKRSKSFSPANLKFQKAMRLMEEKNSNLLKNEQALNLIAEFVEDTIIHYVPDSIDIKHCKQTKSQQ